MRRRIVSGVLALLVAFSPGASSTGLVTGCQPRRLGDSPAARRAYYADKYSPEARAAGQEKTEELRTRRPAAPGTSGGPSPY